MRFPTEQNDPENAGLAKARALLDGLAAKHGLSTADVYVLGGFVAFEQVGGPKMQFSTGRRDVTMDEAIVANGTPTGCPFGDSTPSESRTRNLLGARASHADQEIDPSQVRSTAAARGCPRATSAPRRPTSTASRSCGPASESRRARASA